MHKFYLSIVKPIGCTLSQIYFGKTLHVSNGFPVHHQEFKTVHTASGIRHTVSMAACQQAATEPVSYDAVCTILDS